MSIILLYCLEGVDINNTRLKKESMWCEEKCCEVSDDYHFQTYSNDFASLVNHIIRGVSELWL